MASFALISTGKILWGTVHAKDISVTFSAGTKGRTIVGGNILADAASMQHPGWIKTHRKPELLRRQDGQHETSKTLKNKSQSEATCPKTIKNPRTALNGSTSMHANQVSESTCSASHLMSGFRHLNAWVSFCSRVYPFSGWAENTCVPWVGQLKWKSEHFTQVPSKKASCSRHPHLLSQRTYDMRWHE